MTILTRWLCFLVVFCLGSSVQSVPVPKTVIKGAVEKGAVCLDGSPPTYYFLPSTSEGERNWLVYLGGGGWCVNTSAYDTPDYSVQSCKDRVKGNLGSSLNLQPAEGRGIFADVKSASYFYNWNRIVVQYCDGGSFLGDADKPDPVTNLYYRGARIFQALVDDLMAKGLKDAHNVILAGGSAGGLGVMAHCDYFRSLFSKDIRVKCLADSSLFLLVQDPQKAKFFKTIFSLVVDMQQPVKALPSECTSKMSPFECFLPKNLVLYVKSPLFIFHSAYDSFQVRYTYSEDLYWAIKNHTYISPIDMAMLQDFGQQIKNALPQPSATKGYILTSLFGHAFASQTYKMHMFADQSSGSIEKAFVDWYFDRSPVNLEDPSTVPYFHKVQKI